jgi:hypothetical protein
VQQAAIAIQQAANSTATALEQVLGEVSPVPEMVDADRTEGSRLLTGPTGLADTVAQRVKGFSDVMGGEQDGFHRNRADKLLRAPHRLLT